MELCHREWNLHSAAAQRIAEYVDRRREQGVAGQADFETFEQELHGLIMALECELVGEELSRYDVSATEIEVAGQAYRTGIRLPETYLTAAGLVTVQRHLYYPVEGEGPSICPLELQVGIIGGYFTPRAARQGAFLMAHLTSGESEAAFAEIGNMRPSRSSLDRLTKTLSEPWEGQRETGEVQLRQGEALPRLAATLALSVDGVMAPLRGEKQAEKAAKAEQAGKHASGPIGYKEVGCGTVTLYDQEANRLRTLRYARMPEPRKVTLQQQLTTEAQQWLEGCPTLRRVHLSDGAHQNWSLLAEIEQQLPPALQPPIQIVDYYHACDHLQEGCDAIWGETSLASQAQFERLKTLLKEREDGADILIATFHYYHLKVKGNRCLRVGRELTYFSNQRERMHYAHYLALHLPIASGVMEASCKTLVTQRLKRSGMTWTTAGGQAILTLRSFLQSERWAAAWSLLHANFRKPVKVLHPSSTPVEQHAPLANLPWAV